MFSPIVILVASLCSSSPTTEAQTPDTFFDSSPSFSINAPLFSPSPRVSREDGKELTAEQRRIAEGFSASSVCFKKDGRVSLRYDFESKEEILLDDWVTNVKDRNAVRWSRGWEGSRHKSQDGLLIADAGSFIHKSDWIDATVSVDYLSIAGTRPKDLLAAVFAYDKGKKVVGSHLGDQCVQLKGFRRTSRCIPKRSRAELAHDQRINFGFKLEHGVVHAQRDGMTTVDSSKNTKFLKNLKPGRVGLVWKGRVQGFVFSVTIEGRLAGEALAQK